jgi:hypothetical protein
MKTVLQLSVAVILFFMGVSVQAAEAKKPITDPVNIFENGVLRTVGGSEEGLTRYKALREAQLHAHHELNNTLQGLSLVGPASIEEGMEQSNEIRKSVETFLTGVEKCGQVYHENRGRADVCLQIRIKGTGGLYEALLSAIQDPEFIPGGESFFTPAQEMTVAGTVESDPKASSPFYDGLIVDTRDFSFSPALVNRVVTDKDEILHTPTRIQSDILVERGCGGFSTDEGEAIGILQHWGSTNPLVVTCKAVRDQTDAVLSQNDAVLIYANDQSSDLFSQARVVFVTR